MAKFDEDMQGRDTLNFKTNRFCFCIAKFLVLSCHQRRFLISVVTSLLAKKTRSNGAVEAGLHRILEATGNNEKHKSYPIVFTLSSSSKCSTNNLTFSSSSSYSTQTK